MSHDLKAPLNAILGFAELASRNPLSDSQRESLTIVEQRGRELLHLIETILDAARVEAGELVIAPELTMVGDVVMAAVLEARELVAEGEVSIVGEIQPGVPRIYVDPTRVTQALRSVVLTAIRFAEPGGMVRVRATVPAAGERLRINVEVPGRGVPGAELERVFEAFKDAERARRHGSLGLGLSLARSILEQHGGAIDAGATDTVGTEFHVYLPVADPATSGRFLSLTGPSAPRAGGSLTGPVSASGFLPGPPVSGTGGAARPLSSLASAPPPRPPSSAPSVPRPLASAPRPPSSAPSAPKGPRVPRPSPSAPSSITASEDPPPSSRR